MTDALERLVVQLDNDASLLEPTQLRQRLETLDILDAHFPDIHHSESVIEPKTAALHRRASAIRIRLESANHDLYKAIRSEILRGSQPHTLLRWARSSVAMEDAIEPLNGIGYDYLDELISGVFQFEEPNVAPVQRDSEIVFYQPTPARHIFSLISLTTLSPADVLIDLGSGLGHVSLLVSVCTLARCIGIEIEAAYVERARQCAQQLNLNQATFLHQDVRDADLSIGTIFYLYTPFTGSILRQVLNHLRREAATRPIRICTYGPCTSVIAEESWLEAAAAPATNRITLFRSRS
ncbi:class I SAM-dependent methyltransferase [Acidobacterium sp. S8]|uniref:class I SAM-dependent methyltransferase n=1 Tax=Acidobacterium sp. S8 TaxID=1641854 RepID=UPI00131ABB76|nr:class I SAM-dependent methyltransferase [Acidobacterium sp. S8]